MKSEKNTHGGKREGASPPKLPKGEHKKNVVVYIEQDFIDELGGKKKLQEDIREYVYHRIIVQHHQKSKT